MLREVCLRGALVAERGHGGRAGADEDEAGGADERREGGVFAEVAVARVDGVGAGAQGEVDEEGGVEVGVGGAQGEGAEGDGFVGLEGVEGGGVPVGWWLVMVVVGGGRAHSSA